MHAEAFSFVRAMTKDRKPKTILELGSRDINGSPRILFPHAVYTGIDLEAGEGVDIVADAASWEPDGLYDLVFCLEVMEHTPDWPQIIDTAHSALNDGGLFVITAATDPRKPHSAVDGGELFEGEYYENVDPEKLGQAIKVSGFKQGTVWVRDWGDVYAIAIR